MLRKQAFRVFVLRNRLPHFKRGRTLVQFWKTHQISESIFNYLELCVGVVTRRLAYELRGLSVLYQGAISKVI